MGLLASIIVLVSLLLGYAGAMDAQNSEATLSAYRREVLENYSKGNLWI